MNRFVTLLALFMALHAVAQSNVSKHVDLLLAQGMRFERLSLLTVSPQIENADIQKAVNRATFAKLKSQQIAEVMQRRYDYVELEIPYLGQTVVVQLYKADVFAKGFHVDTDRENNLAYAKGVHYRGKIKGDDASVASFNFFDGEFNGVMSGQRLVNIVVGKLGFSGNDSDYIVYSDADLSIKNYFDCKTTDETSVPPISPSAPTSERCVTLYFEIDYNLYQQNGSNTTITSNWISAVFNNVQTLYANDGITIALKSVFIWTNPDPYDGMSDVSSDYLEAFAANRPTFDGDLGQLVGIDPGGLGGIAQSGLNLCTNNRYSYSDLMLEFNEVPLYSWTVNVISHEFGHLMGSPHTHDCLWNGNNTAIDGCGPLAGYDGFGNCADGPIPSSTVKGTIMSYCHLVSGIGINFANGFGAQPSARMISEIDASACLSTDCINTCNNSVTNIQANVGVSTATITWEDTNPAITQWRISVQPYSAVSVWVTVTTNSYEVEGLLPNKFYRIRIQPLCQADLNGLVTAFQIFQTGAAYCDGITLTNAPVFGNYTINQDYTRTIAPSLPDQKIQLQFTDFGLGDGDYLYLYDGNSTSAPDLSNGGFSGAANPGSFVSTAADGSLTLRFVTDAMTTAGSEGYRAFADCISTLGISGQDAPIDFTYYPNPTHDQVTIESKTPMTEIVIHNVMGQMLYDRTMQDLKWQVGLESFSSGTYFFTVKFNDRQLHFKIQKI